MQHNRALRALSYLAATLWLLWRRRREYDVIYCRFLKEQTFAASLAKYIFKLRQPLVACPACASTGGEAEYISGSPLKGLWLKVFKQGVTIVNAMSRQIEQEILGLGFDNTRVSRIPNGIVLPTLKPIPCSNNQVLRIIFVGRLVEQKGIDNLLRSAQFLKDRGRRFELRIIGDGPLQSTLKEYARAHGLNSYVKFVGKLNQYEVANQLVDADLFVLPSRYEGFPGALLEAIAHGLPAVVTRVSGSEEIIDKTIGWLVPVDDANGLATAIEEALNLGRDSLRRMGNKARDKAASQYDINQVSARYLRLFKDITNS
jgi:glycosyltransferase involved in cell wall biosynthesis